jgi:hypothetical protein
MATAAAMGKSTLVRIDKQAMIDTLHSEPTFSDNIRIQEDVWISFSIQRVLLLMAHFGKEGKSDEGVVQVDATVIFQET